MSRIGWLDIVVLVAYLGGTTALGVWLGRNQKNSTDYFVAGRSLPWWAVMFSIVASETSALTFISVPGLAFIGNFGFLQVCLGYIVGRVVVAIVLLPRYFKGELVTAYALLGTRFGPATRRFTSVVFMATRAMADSVRVFASAIPIALIIGPSLPRQWVMPVSILLLGVLTIVYTYKGGMRAVVWTELLQAGVYATGGLAAVLLLGHVVAGGWTHILDAARAQDKLRVFDFYTGIDRPHTIWAGVIGGAFLTMASHGADQTIVQRMLSARSLRDAQKAIIGSGLAVIVLMTLFLTVGIGLWTYFAGRTFDSPDTIFPTFIFERMPHGMIGLLVASILAATMSTHSGAINSLAATTTHDIYLPLSGRHADDPRTFAIGRWFALGWGIVLTAGALFFPEGKTPVVVIGLSIASFTQGALLGAFFLGIMNRRAQQRDAIVGMSVGLTVMAFIVFAKPLSAAYPSLAHLLGPFAAVAWPWYVLIGLTITLTAGSLMALTHASPASDRR
ncbi:MAG: sodium/solute symporter [Gemmatimonadetes bacterium]|nr:sodium/solute symporter [Gemmatimonadota bacterium]MBI3566929.1 sodium/solute symporter [Gemmatimonadota bacterium]